jgi:hypothetical protein
MPLILQIKCRSCHRGPPLVRCTLRFADEPECEYTEFSHSNDALQLNDGSIAILPHPVETEEIKRYNITWDEAMQAGRLLTISLKACNRCGTLHEERSDYSGHGGGCAYPSVLGLIIALLFRYGSESSWWFASVAGFAMLCLTFWLNVKFANARRQKQNELLREAISVASIKLATKLCPALIAANEHCVSKSQAFHD